MVLYLQINCNIIHHLLRKYRKQLTTIIYCLRAISTALVFHTTQTLLCTPISVFMGHLCISDTWNTINNVEKEQCGVMCSVMYYYTLLL